MKRCPECLEVFRAPAPVCHFCGYRSGPEKVGRRAPDVRPVAVVSSPPGEKPANAQEVPFVGRTKELARVRSFLVEASERTPRFARLAGDSGMGKSRLVDEATKVLDSPKSVVRWEGRTHDALTACGPIVRWIRHLLNLHACASPLEIERRIAGYVETVEKLEPADAVSLQALLGTPSFRAAAYSLDPDHVRRNLHRALARLIAAETSSDKPTLVVDHVQWLDSATGSFLDELLEGRILPDLTLLVLTRDRESGWQPPRPPNLELQLTPLNAEERSRLFDAIVPTLQFLPQLREKVIEQSVGTPLFLQELGRLVRTVIEENAGPLQPDQEARIYEVVPLSLKDLVRQRIDNLEERAQWTLEVAAILGLDCSLGLLESFEQIREGLVDRLRVLEGRDIVERQDDEQGPRYRFSEGYVQEVVYASLLDDQRRALHRQAARAIEKAYAGDLDAHLDELAYHYLRAGDPERAAAWLLRAGDRQHHLGEIGGAIETFQKVLDHLSDLRPTRTNLVRGARAMVRQAKLLRFQGEPDQAVGLLDSAQRLADRLKNRYLRFNVGVERTLIDLAHDRAEEAQRFLGELKGEAERLDLPVARCVLRNAHGVMEFRRGRFDPALQAFREAAEIARREDLPFQEADALNNAGLVLWRWGQYTEASRAFRAGASLRVRVHDKFGLVAAYQNLALVQEQLGEVRPAMRNYQQALDYARETGYLQGEATVEVNLSNLQRWTGMVSAAVEHGARSLELAERLNEPMIRIAALENLGLATAAAGRIEEGLRLLERALAEAQRIEAAEKSIAVELNALELRCEGESVTAEDVKRGGELLEQVESAGYRDLVPQACRVKGRLLLKAAKSNGLTPPEYLELSLRYAIQNENVFEEYETLKRLVALRDDAVPAGSLQAWRTRLQRIEEMLQIRPAPEVCS